MTTLFIFKPGFENLKELIQKTFQKQGIMCTEIGPFTCTREFLEDLYSKYTQEPWFEKDLIPAFNGRNCILIRLDTKPNEQASIFGWVRDILGSTNPHNADHDSLRSRFGKNILENVGHTSHNKDLFLREIDILDTHFPDLQVRRAFDVVMDT